MGNFSRDPKNRLNDSIAKHYIGVRLQQGVPVLDADWNEMEDLGRQEFEDLGTWVIGNGVPAGNDGFRIIALIGGGINTLVLTSKAVGIGLSSIEVILSESTAAQALGFDEKNFKSSRFGSSPAQLTGNMAQPFNLTVGSTLVVKADDKKETITFKATGFVNIATATAVEVAAAITTAASTISANVGKGNDFIVKGGDGTTAKAGRIFVEGQMVYNETDLKYTGQPLYQNNELAKVWNVDPVVALKEPSAAKSYIVYLDVWCREVDSKEDEDLVDVRIGIETAIRLRREWAIRVASVPEDLTKLDSPPDGHSFYKLAQLNRSPNEPAINPGMISDQRELELTIRNEIVFLGPIGTVLVDSESFKSLLIVTRDNFRSLIVFLTTKFVTPNTTYAAGEVIGIDALSIIASVADQGIAMVNAKSLNTKGALRFFQQLLEAQSRFVNIWETIVLPLDKGAGKIYEVAYKQLVSNIKTYLFIPPTQTFTSLSDALVQGDLLKAVRAQERINAEVINEVTKPTGSLLVKYLGSPIAAIPRNQSFDVRYQLSGSITPGDDVDVEIFIDPKWTTTLKNADASVPLSLHLDPTVAMKEFIVTVYTPDIADAETSISVKASAHLNPGGLYFQTAQKTFQIGQKPPISEQDFAIIINSIDKPELNGVYQVPLNNVVHLKLLFSNNTNGDVDVTIEPTPAPNTMTPSGWKVGNVGVSLLQHINASDGVEIEFDFKAPGIVDQSLAFVAKLTNGANVVLAETQVSFISVPVAP